MTHKRVLETRIPTRSLVQVVSGRPPIGLVEAYAPNPRQRSWQVALKARGRKIKRIRKRESARYLDDLKKFVGQARATLKTKRGELARKRNLLIRRLRWLQRWSPERVRVLALSRAVITGKNINAAIGYGDQRGSVEQSHPETLVRA